MLRFSFLFSALILPAICFEAGAAEIDLYSADDLQFKVSENKEIVYDKDGKPFSGAVILPDEAQRQMTYFYKDGQKNGVAISRYDDEHIELETTYKDGAKNGDEVMFYNNGKPQYKRTYSNNLLNGEEILFYENGKPRKQSSYVNNVLNGEVNYFDIEGNHIKTETYKDGVLNGPERIIENKTLVAENNYVDGKLDGVCKKFNTQYLTDEIHYKDGKREGDHKTYAADGSVIQIPYHNDKKNGVATIYYPNKKIAQKLLYGNDEKNGVSLKFYANETLAAAENYRADKLDGIGRYFDENGNLTAVKYFADGEKVYDVDLASGTVHELYDAYLHGRLTQLSDKRDLWYPLLWLSLSTGAEDMLQTLDNEMKMYALAINDMSVYKKQNEADYAEQSEKFFFGLTPLSYAVSVAASTDTLQRFLNQIDEQNSDGSTALHCAVKSNNTEIVKYLLAQRADMEIKNKKGNTVLFQAIKDSAQPEIITMLIDNAANVNTSDRQKNTPLMYAFEHEAPAEVISALINAGADTANISKDGDDILLHALKTKQDAYVIYTILKSGQFSHGTDKEKHGALYYAVANDYSPELIKQIAAAESEKSDFIDADALIKIFEKKDISLLQALNLPMRENVDGEGHSALLLAYMNDAAPEILEYLWPQGEEKEVVQYLSAVAEDGKSMLLEALAKNDKAMLQKLLDEEVDTGGAEGKENALFYVLTHDVDADITQIILADSTAEQLNQKLPKSEQPIWKYLLVNNKIDLFKTVLDKLKTVQPLPDEDGNSPLDAVMNLPAEQNGELFELVLSNTTKPDFKALWLALDNDNTQQFAALLEKKPDINGFNPDGENLLTYIVKNNLRPEFAEILHQHGFNFEQINRQQETALDIAVKQKNPELAEKLIEYGANVNRIVDKRSYLMNLTYEDNDITDVILQHNPNLKLVAPEGETVLMAAVKNLNAKIVDYAVERGADVNKRDLNGNTALLYLADAIATNKDAPQDLLLSKVKAIAGTLVAKGADINQRNGDGETVLIRLAQKCPELYLVMAEAFYDFNADSNLKDQTGKTAKDYVSQRK